MDWLVTKKQGGFSAGYLAATGALSALSLVAGGIFCAPGVSFLGALAAARLSTSDGTVLNSCLMWLSVVAGAISLFAWRQLNSAGMRILVIAVSAIATLGAMATGTSESAAGGSKQFPCKSGQTCRCGPRQHGAALNEGHCFNKCCGKWRDVLIKTPYRDINQVRKHQYGWEQRFRVQWPNCVGVTDVREFGDSYAKWEGRPVACRANGIDPDTGKYTQYVQVPFGDGCASVLPAQEDLTGDQLDTTKPDYYQGEYGVSSRPLTGANGTVASLNSAVRDGFYDNIPTEKFLTRECGLDVIDGTKRLFAQETSYSSVSTCDATKCTGVDVLSTQAENPYDMSLPVGTDNSEFYIATNARSDVVGHCCQGFAMTEYGTCKRAVDHKEGIISCANEPARCDGGSASVSGEFKWTGS